ncbi:MAG: MXAN_6640 family putative metalloprotease, partial [Gemmatimonadota bacterium]
MRKLAAAVLLCVVTLALLAGPGFAKLETAEMTTAALIGDAYSKGTISHDEMILQMAYALCAPWKVREDLVGVQIDLCGTPMDDVIRLALPDLPDAVAEEIRDLRVRPSTMTYVETAHFRIHYDTSGTHMIYGWPSTTYRDAMMVEVEHIWTEEVTNLGFRAPPPDGGDPDGGGGNDLYDIYVQNGSLGACYWGYSYNDGPGGYPPNAWTTYVLIENDWVEYPENSPIEWMQIVMAHEFGHACQAAHNIGADTWYKECTSVWLADTLYDDVNHYRSRLSPFLSSLYQSIDYHDGNQRWYGSCVWNFFLSENFGNQIVVDNWWQIQHSSHALEMIDLVLITYGSSMEEAYKEFAIWCWFTGSRDDGNHFEEGAYWPTASVMRGHNSYPASGGPVPTWEPDSYGCNYITLNYPGSGHSRLLVSYDGPSLLSVGNAAYLNYRTSGGVFGEYG